VFHADRREHIVLDISFGASCLGHGKPAVQGAVEKAEGEAPVRGSKIRVSTRRSLLGPLA